MSGTAIDRAQSDQYDRLTSHQRDHARTMGAERNANRKLTLPLKDKIREQSVQPDGRQQ